MNKKDLKHLFLIFVIFIAACIETDIYLPAFPDMMLFFSVSEETIQSLLTWNFIGLCISGPFYGPISDSFGRKRPLMVALGLFLAGSILTLFAQSFSLMLWGRVLQGLGSGGCFTLGTAILFDAFREKKAIQALNKINSIAPFVMAAAPLVGGYLNHVFGFRSNFVAIAVFVLISFILCGCFFDETLPKEKRSSFCGHKIFNDFKQVFFCLPFWQLTLIVTLLFAGYLTFLSEASVLFVMELGVSKQFFPYYQAAVIGGWLLASLTCTYSIERWGTQTVKTSGMCFTVVGGLGLFVTALMTPHDPLYLTIPMIFFAFGFNWTQTPYVGEVMEVLPKIKGITASVLTSTRLLLTAMIVELTSHFYNGTVYPLAFMILGITAIVLPIMIVYEKKVVQKSQTRLETLY